MKHIYFILFVALLLMPSVGTAQIKKVPFLAKQSKANIVSPKRMKVPVTSTPLHAESNVPAVNYRQDSIITYESNSTSEKTKVRRFDTRYNTDGLIQESLVTQLAVLPGEKRRLIDSKSIYTYQQEEGFATTKIDIFEKEPFTTGEWILTPTLSTTQKTDAKGRVIESTSTLNKTELIYDDVNNTQTLIRSTRQNINSPFNMQEKVEQIWDSKFSYIKQELIYRYESQSKQWVQFRKTTYEVITKFGRGYPIATHFDWSNEENKWISRQKDGITIRDEQGREIYSLSFYPISEDQYTSRERAFAYNEKGQCIMRQDDNEKTEYIKIDLTIFPFQIEASEIKFYERSDFTAEWVLTEHIIGTLDAQGFPISVESYRLIGGIWKQNMKSEPDPDNNNPLIRAYIISGYAEDSETWIENTTKSVLETDAQLRIIRNIEYENIGTSTLPIWQKVDMTEYTYSNYQITMIESSLWEDHTYTNKTVYTTYQNGELESELNYTQSSGGTTYTLTNEKYFKQDGSLELMSINRDEWVNMYKSMFIDLPDHIEQIRTNMKVDLNYDGNFDNPNGCRIYYLIDGRWKEVYANVAKTNSFGQLAYQYNLCTPEANGYFRETERTITYEENRRTHNKIFQKNDLFPTGLTTEDEYFYARIVTGICDPVVHAELLKVYVNNQLHIESKQALSIHIYTMTGQLVQIAQLKEGNNEIVLQQGMYLLKSNEIPMKGIKVIIP